MTEFADFYDRNANIAHGSEEEAGAHPFLEVFTEELASLCISSCNHYLYFEDDNFLLQSARYAFPAT